MKLACSSITFFLNSNIDLRTSYVKRSSSLFLWLFIITLSATIWQAYRGWSQRVQKVRNHKQEKIFFYLFCICRELNPGSFSPASSALPSGPTCLTEAMFLRQVLFTDIFIFEVWTRVFGFVVLICANLVLKNKVIFDKIRQIFTSLMSLDFLGMGINF